ncbi:MAG TPA: cysteine--tRNA ligase [Crenotrichaceae bacterium]|nr:cysteine--tRNA ligase [Crenotrichaceae bacterium]
MLEIYNTLTRSKQELIPITPGKIGIYVCGMTVYDYCHLGHARVMIAFDVVVRHLRALGYEVTYVRNITDVDDKIIARAQQNTESIDSLTQQFIDAMHEDERALAVIAPDQEPRATQSMPQIISMIAKLIENNSAYIGSNGDVFYAVNQFSSYGKLSGKRIEELRAGERIDIDSAKRDPMDFVLWKSAKPDEPAWESPWGNGRPGWHIECSAMSTDCLGNHFDIHGGGMDLQFPHHENEIAQSEAATGETFVNLWMHNGFVRVDEEKMSKSLDNFFTVREVIKTVRDPEVIRFFIISSHYRSPLNYSQDNLNEADSALTRLYTALRGYPTSDKAPERQAGYTNQFNDAMNDDFNTPSALSVLFEVAREINRNQSKPDVAATLAGQLRQLGGRLGILQQNADQFLKKSIPRQTDTQTTSNTDENAVASSSVLSDDEINQCIKQRTDARNNKNWELADKIRDELMEQGIILEDISGSTTWRRG